MRQSDFSTHNTGSKLTRLTYYRSREFYNDRKRSRKQTPIFDCCDFQKVHERLIFLKYRMYSQLLKIVALGKSNYLT